MLKLLIIAGILQMVFSQQVAFQDDLMEGQFTIFVEDNLGGGSSNGDEWSERSVVTVRNVKLGYSQVTHTRAWSQHLGDRLKDLAKTNGFYKLRLHSKSNKEPSYIYTFTDACLVYSGGLSEVISLLIDASPSLGGFQQCLVGASVVVPGVSECPCRYQDQHCDEMTSPGSPAQFAHNTTVLIRSPATPAVPDTATFIQKMESINKEKLENKDNRSFLAKYWMYIIPFVLLLATSYGGQEGGR